MLLSHEHSLLNEPPAPIVYKVLEGQGSTALALDPGTILSVKRIERHPLCMKLTVSSHLNYHDGHQPRLLPYREDGLFRRTSTVVSLREIHVPQQNQEVQKIATGSCKRLTK